MESMLSLFFSPMAVCGVFEFCDSHVIAKYGKLWSNKYVQVRLLETSNARETLTIFPSPLPGRAVPLQLQLSAPGSLLLKSVAQFEFVIFARPAPDKGQGRHHLKISRELDVPLPRAAPSLHCHQQIGQKIMNPHEVS
ncbi:hypothetical protein BJV78DRAFT_385388 [Lactifluus subvellereus]|nr:hypothetical protein BJV78DRAFT_385388 [Lactifluus subvellereus]